MLNVVLFLKPVTLPKFPDRHRCDHAKARQLHQASDLFFLAGDLLHHARQACQLAFCKCRVSRSLCRLVLSIEIANT